MKFSSVFSSTAPSSYSKKEHFIKSQKGERVVTFPSFFDENAVYIAATRYLLPTESSWDETVTRVVDFIVQRGDNFGYFDSEVDRENFRKDLFFLVYNQYGMFNSPVFFNFGNPASNPQASACFILSAEDTLESIAENAVLEMQIFKSGSGCGSNRSKLRSSRERIRGGGYSSGPVSFMKIYDVVADVTKSGGKTRRAAKMEILDVDHPDILEFINAKRIEEEKAFLLKKHGYKPTLFFQNSNFSVRITKAFMTCLEENLPWALINRVPEPDSVLLKKEEVEVLQFTPQGTFLKINGNWYYQGDDDNLYFCTLESPKKILEEISRSAWYCGDPGVQFADNINEYNLCANDEEIVASNPCSEYLWFDDTSCNLASLNLMKFVTDTKEGPRFNYFKFVNAIRIFITAMDIIVDAAYYPSPTIADKTRAYRTLGLGYTNLGALLIKFGVPYDSDTGRNFAAFLTAVLHVYSLHYSSQLAHEFGPFLTALANQSHIRRVLQLHRDSLDTINADHFLVDKDVLSSLKEMMDSLLKNDPILLRNAQVTVIAPTGTISLVMGCDTTGIEPLFSRNTYKELMDGKRMKLYAKCVEEYLNDIGASSFEELSEHQKEVLKTAIDPPALSPEAHLKMLAAVQPFVSGGISKTINLPNSATVEDIMRLYKKAHKMKIKCVAVYRDGSKASQVLISDSSQKSQKERVYDLLPNGRPIPQRKPLPTTRKALTHKFEIGGVEGYLTLGLYDDEMPGEVFLRVTRSGSSLSGAWDCFAIVLSVALQYGVPASVLLNKLIGTQFEPFGMTKNPDIPFSTSLADYIAKFILQVLRKENTTTPVPPSEVHVSEQEGGITFDKLCNECGGPLLQSGTCYVCTRCGQTSGCS